MKKSDRKSNKELTKSVIMTDSVNWKKLRKRVKKSQNAKRYEHTLGVEYTSAALAMRYGADMEEAQLAGLLHDCAKCLPDKELLTICDQHDIPVSKAEHKSPYLLHGKVGGYLAKTEYGVKNQDIINAIIYHTTGRPGMTLLEKIVFVADYIEPGRKRAKGLGELRELAFRDLDAAVLRILDSTLGYLKETSCNIDPRTEETWKYYKNQADLRKQRSSDMRTAG